MSIEFCIVLNKEADLTALKHGIQVVLKEVLNLSSDPNVEVKGLGIALNSLREVGDTITVKIGVLAEAKVIVMNLSHDETDPFAMKPTALVSAGSLRAEESWTLVIALAIALGQMINANVIDDSQLLSSSLEESPTRLLERIKLTEEQDDLSQASHEFLKRLGLV